MEAEAQAEAEVAGGGRGKGRGRGAGANRRRKFNNKRSATATVSTEPEEALSLHDAARSGNLNDVQHKCFSNPSSINTRDSHSRTPLHLAAWAGQTEVVEFLCKHKADVGAAAIDDMAAIHFASQKGHFNVVRILVRSGASVNASTRKGMTPLHYAVQGGHLELVKFLVSKGANVSAKNKAGKLPIDVAKNDEICSVLTNYKEMSKTKQDLKNNLPIEDCSEGSEKPCVAAEVEDVTRKDQSLEDADSAKPDPPSKKAKVALSHLFDDENNVEH